MADDPRTPEQLARDAAEKTGIWPEGWGPFHRHFANDAIHRDGGPECDQPGTARRVYAFDGDYLDEHERYLTERVRAETLTADPLRALLADERQALELLASALWELDCAAAWDGTAFADLDEQTRTAYLKSRERKNRAVLAALREVAGL